MLSFSALANISDSVEILTGSAPLPLEGDSTAGVGLLTLGLFSGVSQSSESEGKVEAQEDPTERGIDPDLQSLDDMAAEEHYRKVYSPNEDDKSESRRSVGSDEADGSGGENTENYTEFNDLDEENIENFFEELDALEKKRKNDALASKVKNMSIEDLTSPADEGDQSSVGIQRRGEGGGGRGALCSPEPGKQPLWR